MQNRTLDLHPTLPGFVYKYEVCGARVLGICTRRDLKTEVYDLRDEKTRRQLIDMGFVARVRERH